MKTSLLCALVLGTTLSFNHGHPHRHDLEADTSDIAAAIALLRSDTLKSECVMVDGATELIIGLQRFLTRQTQGERGAKLVEHYCERLEREKDEEAMIMLSRYEALPAPRVERWKSSPKPYLRYYANWSHAELDWENVHSDPTLYRTGLREGPDPIALCRAEIAKALIRPPEELAKTKEEFQEGYREVLLPNLERLEDFVPEDARYWVDLDGDGIDEFFAHFVMLDGWENSELTVRMAIKDGRWTVREVQVFRLLERTLPKEELSFVICDFDGDGRPEVLEHCYLSGGWVHQIARLYDEGDRRHDFISRHLECDLSPVTGRPVLVERSAFNPTGGGKASYLHSMLGTRLEITEFHPHGETTVTDLIVRRKDW